MTLLETINILSIDLDHQTRGVLDDDLSDATVVVGANDLGAALEGIAAPSKVLAEIVRELDFIDELHWPTKMFELVERARFILSQHTTLPTSGEGE